MRLKVLHISNWQDMLRSMAEIEMFGGSEFHMDHGREEGAAQKTGGGGDIQMLGGSDFDMQHKPIPSEQMGKGESGIDMIGLQGLTDKNHYVSPYGQKKPVDHGTE